MNTTTTTRITLRQVKELRDLTERAHAAAMRRRAPDLVRIQILDAHCSLTTLAHIMTGASRDPENQRLAWWVLSEYDEGIRQAFITLSD
jgi:hypothetical protein